MLYTHLSSRAGMTGSFVIATVKDAVSPHCCHLIVSVLSTEICTLLMYQDKHGIQTDKEMQINCVKESAG